MASGITGSQELSPQHHVARYCRRRHLALDGTPLDEAFLLREGETYLSANWLEHFHPTERRAQITAVRRTLMGKGRTVARTEAFAVLNIGTAIDFSLQELNLDIRFIALGERHDPSHTGIYGLEENKADAAHVLAKSVNPTEVHPAA